MAQILEALAHNKVVKQEVDDHLKKLQGRIEIDRSVEDDLMKQIRHLAERNGHLEDDGYAELFRNVIIRIHRELREIEGATH